MQTLAYEDYSSARFARHSTLFGGAGQRGFFAGLSPFDIPEDVEIQVFADDRCVFRFRYANSETPEPRRRVFGADPDLSVLLGEHSKKILELHVEEAMTKLSQGNIRMDLSEFEELSHKLPLHAAKASVRNASLVQAVLISIPRKFREQIIQTLIESHASAKKAGQ